MQHGDSEPAFNALQPCESVFEMLGDEGRWKWPTPQQKGSIDEEW